MTERPGCKGCGKPADFITHTTIEALTPEARAALDADPALARGTWAVCIACACDLGDRVEALARRKSEAPS